MIDDGGLPGVVIYSMHPQLILIPIKKKTKKQQLLRLTDITGRAGTALQLYQIQPEDSR